MRILSFTAGAASMYCGSCLRDNALAGELMRQGHAVVLMPLYTPTRTDEKNVSEKRVFLGGISIYLEQKLSLFRHTPKFLDRLWDLPGVISLFAGRGVTVDPGQLGALTVSMLEGVAGHQHKEIANLARWLRDEPKFDIVSLPFTLLISLAKPLREAVGCPIVCNLQGEELFLDGLTEPWRSRAIDLIRSQVGDVDGFIAVSHYQARHMTSYLGIAPERIQVVPLGINLDGYRLIARERRTPRRIGYFARVAPEKGLDLLAEAYCLLRKRTDVGPCVFEAAGYIAPEQRGYLAGVKQRFEKAGLTDEFHYHGELDREAKLRFLQSLDVLSLPATYDEPKGFPVLEAMANGVPVVQPRRGAFPEMVETTGGGLLVDPDSPEALATGLAAVLNDHELAARLGRAGYEGVRQHYSIELSAERTLAAYSTIRLGSISGNGGSGVLLDSHK
jgi:glycosyltransferase involved in cell wall biosynthesis